MRYITFRGYRQITLEFWPRHEIHLKDRGATLTNAPSNHEPVFVEKNGLAFRWFSLTSLTAKLDEKPFGPIQPPGFILTNLSVLEANTKLVASVLDRAASTKTQG